MTHLRDLLLAAFLGAAALYVAIFGWAWLGRDRPLEERGEPSWRDARPDFV